MKVISSLPAAIPVLALVAGMGGWIGAEYGSRRFESRRLARILAVILVIAGFKIGIF